MKKTIQESLSLLSNNRSLLVLCIVEIVLALSFIIYIALSVRPSELQLVSHCSAFGFTHLYRDQWFYLLNFGLFGLVAAIMHVTLTVKTLTIKGKSVATGFVWLGIIVMLFAWTTAFPVLNILSGQDCRTSTSIR